ncbi:mucin-2-like [Penaeus indicus]|uniref:mucin-2-like n=1 Tax=Penaeus indicus TaxID=29960 RepID=UPI00300D9AED
MKVTWFIWATAVCSGAWAAPQGKFDPRKTVEQHLPTGNVVTSISKATVQGHVVDEGQISVDDLFRHLSDSTPATQPSSQPTPSVFPTSNAATQASTNALSASPASLPAQQVPVNRQGLLSLPGRPALGNVNIFIDDRLRESLENDDIFLENAFQPQGSAGVALPTLNSAPGGSNNQNFGSLQPAGQSVFISSGGNSAPSVNAIPLGALSPTQGPRTFSGSQNAIPVRTTGSTGVPLTIFNNGANHNSGGSSGGSPKNFVTPVPISSKPKVAHTQTAVNFSPLPAQPKFTQTPTTSKPTVITKSALTTKPLPVLSSANTPSESPFLDSFTSAPTSGTTKPPAHTSFGSRDLSASLLSSLLTTLSNKITNPNQSFGNFLKSINGQNGVLVLPSSSLGRSVDSAFDSSPSSSQSSFSIDFGFDTSSEIDLDTDDSDTSRVSIVSSDVNALSFGGSDTKSSAGTTTVAVETTTEPIAKVKTPVSLFRGPLSDILFTKGQWLGTLVGGLVDISRTVVGKIREGARQTIRKP